MLHSDYVVACSYTNLELAFVVDSSTKSTGNAAWQSMLTFVNSVIDGFSIGSTAVRVAFVQYGYTPAVAFNLIASGNKTSRSVSG